MYFLSIKLSVREKICQVRQERHRPYGCSSPGLAQDFDKLRSFIPGGRWGGGGEGGVLLFVSTHYLALIR